MLQQVSKFNHATEVFFGNGSLQQLTTILRKERLKRLLVIADPGVLAAGLVERVEEQLKQTGSEWKIFSEVEPNPSVETVEKAFAELQAIKGDSLIAIGGGSAIDVAKAVGVLATNGGKITEYEGIDKFSNPIIPLIAIPTTAGSASEVTSFTVITDTKRKYKLTVGGRKLAATYAIADPLLTVTMPPNVTASTGMDALVHAIESYTSLMAYPLSELLALEAIRVISANLRQAVYHGENLQARGKMLYGSLVAGIAFNNTRLGNVHAMSHPVSAMFGVAHGVANSILLPHVMEFNVFAVPEKFATIAEAMGCRVEGLSMMEKAEQAILAVKKLSADIGIPKNLREVGVKEEAIPEMARDAFKSGNILVNPRKTSVEDLIDLYHKAMS